MKILLINNHSILNIGDYAILLQTLRLLEQTFPDARIALSFNDWQSAEQALPGYSIYPSPHSWSERAGRLRWLGWCLLLGLHALIYRLSGRLPRLLADRRKHALLQEYAAADLVLACGGGYLYSVSPREGRQFIARALSAILALLMRRPLVLLPQSIGPLHSALHRRLAGWIVRRARLSLVRERRSLDLLAQQGCAQRALHAPDMAFGMPGGSCEQARDWLAQLRLDELSPAFLVGMTALDWGRQNYRFDRQRQYESALAHCIDAITAQGGVVLLFAQCCGPTPIEDDRLVNARLRGQVRQPERVIALDQIFDPAPLQALYGHMDYFIGTRMHSVILALNAGTPVLPIGYLHKTRGLVEELGLQDRFCDITSVDGPQLALAFERLRQQPEAPGRQAYLQRAERSKRALGAMLRPLAGQP